MFLKSIILRGFKSFNQPTTINFIDGLVVVVGPNGSGKSNINDAFKWVMGEQSKKNLRAKNSNDMIFSGSETEKPSDMAEVSLIFNNENRILNIEFDEVEITRRAYRDQEFSEYYINKTLVRRKDVKNLFLDTGLGNIDLTVVSQGSVSKITEAKPDELKELLNEASGVSRYSSQKEEAIRKLERVSQNLEIFEVKLKELEKQIAPLKKQREKAEVYLKIKKELDQIELSYIKTTLPKWIKTKEELLELLTTSNHNKEKATNLIEEITISINHNQEKLIKLDEDLFKLQNRQSEINQKITSDISDNNIGNIEKNINEFVLNIKHLRKTSESNKEKIHYLNQEVGQFKAKEESKLLEKNSIEYKINSIEYELNKSKASYYDGLDRGTKAIIENKQSFGKVAGLVSELIKYDSKLDLAINLTLGGKLKNIVVDNENTIKEVIAFLKNNKLGSATLIPYQKVVSKNISYEVNELMLKQEGYLGTLASNIKTDPKFQNTIEFLAGNILLFDDIENALEAAKIINYKFMLVSLSGEIIYPGFVVRGGYFENKSFNNSKDYLSKALSSHKNEFDNISQEIFNLTKQIETKRQENFLLENENVRISERLIHLESQLETYLNKYHSLTGKEYKVDFSFGENEDFVSFEQIAQKIKTIQNEKLIVSKTIIEAQKEEANQRNIWQKSMENISKSEIELTKLNSKIDINLQILARDYKMTYETLLENNEIHLLKEDAIENNAQKISDLRNDISRLGFINVEAIEQYDSLSKEYETLKTSTQDLTSSKASLLSTIEVMDGEMKDKLSDTFHKINNSLKTTFNALFGGGKGELKYSNEENILESGIEFIGQTPGKVVKSITLYSGGEKSLMALALLFAIADVKKLPLLMLDEVEAALDESNVDKFARYAKLVNDNKTQTIITTHRPGTMEMADILYGVTMQVKGISKVVSVKLQDAKEMVD